VAVDLGTEAQRLRLDALAVALSRDLGSAGVPHALIKGPTTATWLYPEGRPYRDVDLLVPMSHLPDAVAAIATHARPLAAAFEECPHSQVLVSTEGFEVDLHASPPGTTARDDRWWELLSPGVVTWEMDVGSVPALRPAARCLVVALHWLESGPADERATADLRRALARPDAPWREAGEIADAAGVRDLFDAAVTGTAEHGLASLHLRQAPPAAFALQRFADARARDRIPLLWREILPSRGFMARHDPRSSTGRAALARAHVRRWLGVARQLPSATRAYRASRG
jgi:hypothetical protein